MHCMQFWKDWYHFHWKVWCSWAMLNGLFKCWGRLGVDTGCRTWRNQVYVDSVATMEGDPVISDPPLWSCHSSCLKRCYTWHNRRGSEWTYCHGQSDSLASKTTVWQKWLPKNSVYYPQSESLKFTKGETILYRTLTVTMYTNCALHGRFSVIRACTSNVRFKKNGWCTTDRMYFPIALH